MIKLLIVLAALGGLWEEVDCGRRPFTDVHNFIEFDNYYDEDEVWIVYWYHWPTECTYMGLGYCFDVGASPSEWQEAAGYLIYLQGRHPKNSAEIQKLVDYCLKAEDKRAVEFVPRKPDKVLTKRASPLQWI